MIPSNLSYKHIYYIVIVGVILLAGIAYSLSWSNTIHAITEYYELKGKVENMKDAPQKIQHLKQQINQMEHLLVEDKGIDIEQLLLEKNHDILQRQSFNTYRISTNIYQRIQQLSNIDQ